MGTKAHNQESEKDIEDIIEFLLKREGRSTI
ncbi:hypothetical protein WBP_0201 [Wolbachia endosymbiont of Brugia pahangi]|nr:hypothetical protein WBP_0201 [Wolbachia endosymbiont of Brugia pahangi]